MHKTPPSAWENGLREALERLETHVLTPDSREDLQRLYAVEAGKLDARDQAALAYVLWRLRDAPDVDPAEPVRAPGKRDPAGMGLSDQEFFGLVDWMLRGMDERNER